MHLAPLGPLGAEKQNYVGLDCEMVGVGTDGKQSALARVSITDYDGNVILDTHVHVQERVTDFRTHVSGVRAKDLKGRGASVGVISVKECQKLVFGAVDGKILVGHTLRNDFKALLYTHPKHLVRDTSRYKPYMRASGSGGGKLRPRKLRDLAKEKVSLRKWKAASERSERSCVHCDDRREEPRPSSRAQRK